MFLTDGMQVFSLRKLKELCSADLFHQWGDCEPLMTDSIIERSRDALIQTEAGPFANYVPYTHHTGRVLQELAAYNPRTLAAMHGSSFSGDCAHALLDLATVMAEVLGPRGKDDRPTSEDV